MSENDARVTLTDQPFDAALTVEIPFNEAATMLGVTSERVRQLVKAGFIERGRRGFVPLVSAVQGYLNSLHEAAQRRADAAAAGGGLANARAREIELRMEHRMVELMDRGEVEAALHLVVEIVKKEMMTLPDRLPDAGGYRERARTDMEQIFQRLDRTHAEAVRSLRGNILEQ